MLASVSQRKPSIMLVGSGNLAQALGPALRRAGYRITAIASRHDATSRRRAAALARKVGARVVGLAEAVPEAAVVWLCHTDDALAETARLLARQNGWRGKIALHSSGALTSDVLSPLRRAGAHVGSLHPMMTFVAKAAPEMSEVPFAVEGDRRAVAAAKRVVKDLGAQVFDLKKQSKVLYHALGSFSSPMVVAALVTAERVGKAAGLTEKQTRAIMAPILRQTLANYLEHGAAAAFSGPIRRGDMDTVRRHVRELKGVPDAMEVYRALVKSALRDLPSARKKEMMKLLGS